MSLPSWSAAAILHAGNSSHMPAWASCHPRWGTEASKWRSGWRCHLPAAPMSPGMPGSPFALPAGLLCAHGCCSPEPIPELQGCLLEPLSRSRLPCAGARGPGWPRESNRQWRMEPSPLAQRHTPSGKARRGFEARPELTAERGQEACARMRSWAGRPRGAAEKQARDAVPQGLHGKPRWSGQSWRGPGSGWLSSQAASKQQGQQSVPG